MVMCSQGTGQNGKGDDLLLQYRLKAEDAPVLRLLDGIIVQGLEAGASDIHLEPGTERNRVRYRIDGVLRDMYGGLPLRLKDVLISRLKIMAKLDTTERRLPQDGRIAFGEGETAVDIRVSTMPVLLGETAVLRLLSGARRLFSGSTFERTE